MLPDQVHSDQVNFTGSCGEAIKVKSSDLYQPVTCHCIKRVTEIEPKLSVTYRPISPAVQVHP